MVRISVRIGLFFILLILLSGSAGAEEDITKTDQPETQGKKTLTRTEDYIVVHGKKLKKNLKKKISNMSLFASVDGKVRPIPFQIDEVDPEGEWVLTIIPPHLKDTTVKPDKDDDNGHLDKNDELVFMVRDSGDRIPEEQYPEGSLAVDEITLADPIDGGKSWVYLCTFPKDPPLSDKDYVEYVFPEGDLDRVVGRNYEQCFLPGLPGSPGTMSIEGSENLLDRIKMRLKFRFFGIPFSLDESMFSSELALYNDGPIRVIRRIRNAVKISKDLKTKSAAIENIYYDNATVVPIKIYIPVSLRLFSKILQIEIFGGADYRKRSVGARLLTNVDPRWADVDGKMDEFENSINGKDFNWFLISWPECAGLTRIVLNRRPDGSLQKTPIRTSLSYIDDDTFLDPPEDVPGQSPKIGYTMEGFTKLPRGTWFFYLVGYYFKEYKDGIEEVYLKILDQQIKVLVD
ncbi:MAG: hypothetical protein JSU92_14945 [Deltaproteobacteria bacterium]|nr:MAG: hypothetical protein JSU92_14945 [Deltaproteobacteria bacterium]